MAPAYWTRIELAVPVSSSGETASIAAKAWWIAGSNANIVVESDEISLVSAGAYIIRPSGMTDGIALANVWP